MGTSFPTDDANAINILAKAIAHEIVRELAALNTPPEIVEAKTKRSVFEAGPIVVDVDRHEATVAGRVLNLKRREFALLATFTENAGHVLSREKLLELAWPADAALSVDTDRTIDVHVLGLRRKSGAKSQLLQTVKGWGYKLRDR